MEEEIRKIIALYGFKKIYSAMKHEMNEVYNYLKQVSNIIIKPDRRLLNLSIDIKEEKGEPQEIVNKVFNKKEHLEQIQKKNEENLFYGIDPYSLLTKDNLELWIKEGNSYMKIARDYVGLSDSIISEYARKFNLKSTISLLISQKRR